MPGISLDDETLAQVAHAHCQNTSDACACGPNPDAACREEAAEWIKAIEAAGFMLRAAH